MFRDPSLRPTFDQTKNEKIMTSLNTLITFSLLLLSTLSFANEDESKSKKNSVPVAVFVWETSEAEIPSELRFLKAKSAFVPVTEFVWGNPSDVPAILNMVPIPAYILEDSNELVPQELAFVKAKSAFVPVAHFITGDPTAAVPSELIVH